MRLIQRFAAIATLFLVPLVSVLAQDLLTAPQESIRRAIESRGPAEDLAAAGQRIFARNALPQFYRGRDYRLAWSKAGVPTKALRALVEALEGAAAHGLNPDDYHRTLLKRLIGEFTGRDGGDAASRNRVLAELDLLATDAFLIYASHLQSGRVNPTTFDAEWHASRRGANVEAVLDRVVASGDVEGELKRLLPQHKGYGRLMNTLERYRKIAEAGGFPRVEPGATLRSGDSGPRVIQLRRRLAVTGDLVRETVESSRPDSFDVRLESAVKIFQRRHGLADDGVVGAGTIEALNASVENRIEQIQLNLERWRWLAEDLGRVHILVNIAAFELEVFEEGREVMSKRVIIGRSYRRTPVFSGRMTYLVLSPYWNVPYNLAVKDKLPDIKKDLTYLQKQRMRVFSGSGDQELDPLTIDWPSLSAKNFPYRLRQDPGPSNALGKVKFMFPNRFNVYLHDTPSRELFDQPERAFSSGCIRVQEPLDLAEYLLAKHDGWSRQKIEATVEVGREQTVMLKEPVHVHLQYWTAWVDNGGRVNFRKDVYMRDGSLAGAMSEPPPSAL